MSMRRFDFQIAMMQQGTTALLDKINHLNDIQIKLKVALTTLWSVVAGWAITNQSSGISMLGYCVILGFLYPDILIIKTQDAYVEKLSQIYYYLNDLDRLERSFEEHQLPSGLVYPLSARAFLKPRETKAKKNLKELFLSFKRPYIIIPYIFLGICNLLVSRSLS